MINAIEINCYCEDCGNEMTQRLQIDPKTYNGIRINITSCKTCAMIEAAETLKKELRSDLMHPKPTTLERIKRPYHRKLQSAAPTPPVGGGYRSQNGADAPEKTLCLMRHRSR